MSTSSRVQKALISDQRDDFTDHFVNISSANRDKEQNPSSDDVTYRLLDGINEAQSIDIENFEIPHTRYAIDSTNNTLYISEEITTGVFNYFGLRVSTGGYFISHLANSLELSTQSAISYTEDTVLENTYTFTSSKSFGKVAIISSGDVPYNIHACKSTLTLVSFTKVSDTEASVQFIAPYENILAPGALLTLNIYKFADREVQVLAVPESRTVTIMGDFSDIEDADVEVSNSHLIPYSAENSVSEVAGFGISDLEISKHTGFDVIGLGSPFATSIENNLATPTVLVNFPPFLSSEDHCIISGTDSFLDGEIVEIGQTTDDTHFKVSVLIEDLWAGSSIRISGRGNTWDVSSIDFVSSSRNIVTLNITPDTPTPLQVGDIVEFTGFEHQSEWDNLSVRVSSIAVSDDSFNVRFSYSTKNLLKDGVTVATPVNPDTGIATTYLGPNRFDLSRGRRVIICRATVDGVDIGTMQIPNDPTTYFGRIQLFSGADLVNFLDKDSAIGHYKFPGRVKKLRTIRLRFVNEDGSTYNFENVDYSFFLRIRSSIGHVV